MDSLEHFTCQNAISCMRLGTQQSDIGHREYSSLWSGFKLNCEITEVWLKQNKFELMPRQTVTRRYCWQFKHLCMKNVTIIPQIPQFQVQFIYFPPVTDHWPGRHARKFDWNAGLVWQSSSRAAPTPGAESTQSRWADHPKRSRPHKKFTKLWTFSVRGGSTPFNSFWGCFPHY